MRTVRYSVFETNSSSTHCVTFVTQSELDAFINNELVYDSWTGKMIPAADMYNSFKLTVNDMVSHGAASEDVVNKLMPTKEEFAQWVLSYKNVLKGVSIMDADEPAVKCIRRAFRDTMVYREYIVAGHCDYVQKKKDGEDLYALSMYSEND